MELNKLEATTLNEVQIKVNNWKWQKWLHLILPSAAVVMIMYLASDAKYIGEIGVFIASLAGIYSRNVLRNWNGLQQELLLIKCFESIQVKSK